MSDFSYTGYCHKHRVRICLDDGGCPYCDDERCPVCKEHYDENDGICSCMRAEAEAAEKEQIVKGTTCPKCNSKHIVLVPLTMNGYTIGCAVCGWIKEVKHD